MQPADEEELRNFYRSQPDAALLELAIEYDRLTETAKASLREEFKDRGLEPPVLPDPPPDLDVQALVTVHRYRDLADAQLAKSMLESCGLPAFLRDENMVRMEWIWSNLMGGVRLQVRAADVDEAQALLHQPIPESLSADGQTAYEQPRCPRCNSFDIHFQRIHERLGLASILALGIPLPFPKRAWICRACNAQWRNTHDRWEEADPLSK